MTVLARQTSPFSPRGRRSGNAGDEGAVQHAPNLITQLNHTPHPPFGHLLPQGEKGKVKHS